MRHRHIAKTIQLDYSLRMARNMYGLLAILFVPGAVLSAPFAFIAFFDILGFAFVSEITILGTAVWDLFFGVGIVICAYLFVSQFFEARRRLEILAENPDAQVRPMYVPKIFRYDAADGP